MFGIGGRSRWADSLTRALRNTGRIKFVVKPSKRAQERHSNRCAFADDVHDQRLFRRLMNRQAGRSSDRRHEQVSKDADGMAPTRCNTQKVLMDQSTPPSYFKNLPTHLRVSDTTCKAWTVLFLKKFVTSVSPADISDLWLSEL